ncbi:PspC domain-containing protein [Granulicoccus sp. GXG6511]|uniref:PspC domain-containing protein n=1 Tax=Granulicoccus sp. GXG6511 TaxID=3381351 RepID=UPI003D7DCBAE
MEPLTELRRSVTDRKVAGVCVMLADRWRVDPLLVRVAALLLALSSGIGLVLYAAAWAVVPPEGAERAPIDSIVPGVRRLGLKAGIALLVVACIVAAALVGHVAPFGIGPALVIGAVWYFGWYRPEQQRRAVAPRTPEPPQLSARPFAAQTPFTEAAAAWQLRMQQYLAEQAGPANPSPPTTEHDPGYSLQAYLAHPDPVGLYQPTPPPAPQQPLPQQPPAQPQPAAAPSPHEPDKVAVVAAQRKRRGRRTWRLQLVGWALALAGIGTVAALDQSMNLPFFAYPAAVLLAVGITMIIGAWVPRPRGLVVVGALLAVLIGGAAAPVPETPQSSVAYSTVAELPAGVTAHDAGEHVADLSAVLLDGDATYAAAVDVGRLTIVVPPDTNVRVVWAVDVGEADVLGLYVGNGFDLGDTTISQGTQANGPTLTIEARVGLGQLEVKR